MGQLTVADDMCSALAFCLPATRSQHSLEIVAVTAAGVDTEYRGREKPSDHAPTGVALRQRT
jgi:hypothetical protein